MRKGTAFLSAAVIVLSILSRTGVAQAPAKVASFRPAPSDVVRLRGYPEIGKWMIAPDLTWAHWLGEVYEGKALREPVNVIVVDPAAPSAEAATHRLIEACRAAGFESRFGHSSGYWGWLGGRLYAQIPASEHHAFSDEPFEFNNNHGRFFGPFFLSGKYYFIGAWSREKVAPLSREKHEYVSFNQARDHFRQAMVGQAGWQVVALLNLDNALLRDPRVETGDHDGVAVVLTPGKQGPSAKGLGGGNV